ncbi:ATP-binding cassette domain-containing protein [Sedimentitalea todarodis]|uniref:ATP-binding cassette domain-containing protein n=1 Tax=Sedimentitalea todarodis TaxID=1631240 RepID=A0ABU3V9B0_9RHOB|nr:ATP-binding cassette domain-containing protein [Sedimentitalea todarodis]MDU9002747.1 ATP-binding cassette domain-containing protein [Sedimentitalea todarodis]
MIAVDVKFKRFGDTEVLRDIRFTVDAGETVALQGPSGIGKTTLLRLIAGIDNVFDGGIVRPDRLAMVFQEPTLLPWRSAIENIALVHPGLGEDAARAALDRVGIGAKADMFPGQMSLGQQRRLALARAFAARPQALILDEPFVSLDPELAQEMLELARSLIHEERPATIFVTHSREEAASLSDRVLSLGGQPATLVSHA